MEKNENNAQREKTIEKMNEISSIVDEGLDDKYQKRENTIYYKDFKFEGSNLAVKSVYIVEISNEKQEKTVDNSEKSFSTYEIYDKNSNRIATVDSTGKIQFEYEFLEKIRQIDSNYIDQLELDDLNFELPENLSKDDIKLSRDELSEERTKSARNKKEEDKTKDKEDSEKETKDKEETEELKKQKTAEALGIDETEIKSISTLDLEQKVTDKYSLRDMIPEASMCSKLTVAYTKDGNFTLLGTKKDGTREKLNSIESVEGATTNKNIISINEDGSKVEEKQVKGLMRINARNRDDGISVSIGDYGMMNIDYVNNVMDKENRRSTPIRTKEAENQRIANERVRENAGDKKDEMKKEGNIFRKNEEKGLRPQTLDGIETENIDGNITLEELKERIKDELLENGQDMSRSDRKAFIESKIGEAGLSLSESEINKTANEINEEALDESRFPTRNNRY